MHPFYRIAYLFILLLTAATQAAAQTAADYETMYARLYNSLYSPGGSYNLGNLKSDGTFLNVTYPTVQPTKDTGEPRPHLNEMAAIARAYQTPGAQHKSPELLDAYCKAWNWWVTYNPTDTNWWWRSIGWANSLYPSFVLMSADLKAQRPEEYNSLVSYLMFEWSPEKVASYRTEPDAANTSEICKYTLATAIATQNATAISEVSEILSSLIKIENQEKTNGIQPDYSFSQHIDFGRQLYMGSYGKEFIGGMMNFITLTTNTYFEIPAAKMTIFENLFLEGISWVVYRNMFDHHQLGRKATSDGYQKSLSALNSLLQYNTPQKPKLQELYNWMGRSTAASEANVQQGNRMFWRHDYMVHKGANYFTTSRMTSTRTTCSESGNGEGINNFYTGSGVNFIYLTGTEYSEIWDDMNWRRLPGITAPQKTATTALPLVQWGKNGNNLDAFAGGVSDGKTGASGFLFSKRVNEINLFAAKSWFYFDDYFVALGADITAGANYNVPYATTVNQVKYKGGFQVDKNGTPATLDINQALSPVASNWAHINNIGYQFITNTNVNYEVKTVGATPLAWLNIQHGNYPSDDTYAYAVYPNVSLEQLTGKVNNTPFVVVSNTSTVQAVADPDKKIVQAIFYKAARLDLPEGLGFVETDQPAAIQVRWKNDSVYVSAANPYCESRPLSAVTVTIGGLYTGEAAVENPAGNSTSLQLAMPANEFQGSTVTAGLLKSRVTGLKFKSGKTSAMGVYPNPVKAGEACFILNTSTFSKPVQVALYSITGALVREYVATPDAAERIIVDTKNLTQGMYLVRCNSRTGRIVVE
ncbi:polysaccharide lyase family 8 super-sandwich domain-containing protein [Botryobacter ruber]|uniref:polysaccharide lyase family 8 super-sandwich domain-containing protein n=1 Tax=Botryobacter ruber TaxID=2171629 RepID=UPI0013E31207|nr:polysaccharide lyase family 8 super-sandwich domain-containing protein [Botryobacter ruber]